MFRVQSFLRGLNAVLGSISVTERKSIITFNILRRYDQTDIKIVFHHEISIAFKGEIAGMMG